MLLIHCPHCGPRDHSEFSYEGDATLKRPDPATATGTDWTDYIYLRENPKGKHQELWQHVAGCRAFLRVERDTVTHEITATASAVGGAR
jgi:heterotetrameric sarcosine oxidase delta subunit